jgi:hypothetical protein
MFLSFIPTGTSHAPGKYPKLTRKKSLEAAADEFCFHTIGKKVR